MQNFNYEIALKAASYLQQEFSVIPDTAVILGSGLGGFTKQVSILKSIAYSQIPGFPASDVVGHKAQFSLAEISADKYALVMEGRFHYYEGISPQLVTLPIAVFHALGIKNLIVSNAAGGINSSFKVGDLMIIDDQINLTGNHPLIGKNDGNLGPRFVDMSEPFSVTLIESAKKIAKNLGIVPQQGTYLGVSGPTYETKAEIRAFATMGADAVGMSTVYEVIAANYFKINVLGISCITNMATGIAKTKHNHTEVVAAANMVEANFAMWVKNILEHIL